MTHNTPRLTALLCSLLGGICIIVGGILFIGDNVTAQSTAPDNYIGVGDCNDCHRDQWRGFSETPHYLTFVEVDGETDSILADFSVGEDLRLFQFTDDSSPRPFAAEDIAYVVGTGRIAQRYLFNNGDDTYRVLPAQWNTTNQAWETFPLPNGDDWGENCATCHTTGYNPSSHEWIDDGITCESCHGAGLDHVEAADDAGRNIDDEEMVAIKSAIALNPDPSTCESCHQPISTADACDDPIHCGDSPYAAWSVSPHSQMVANEDGDAVSNALCNTCHAPHEVSSIVATNDGGICLDCHEDQPQQLLSGAVVVDQVAGNPSAHHDEGLACESCHNPHSIYAIPEDTTLTASCMNCHSDLTNSGLRNFVDDAQASTRARMSVIEPLVTADTPEWVSAVITTVQADGSDGMHNVAYISQLLNAVEIELGIVVNPTINNVPAVAPSDPIECAECHENEHAVWQTSTHANASLGDTFQQAYAANGQPSYCMSCHASGYDPSTQSYVFEGVVCSTCHTMTQGEHPPGPASVVSSSDVCGRCHSGEHAPAYNEWLVSDHKDFNVDCVDCHVAHDNSLRLDDVNATCADCHEDAMQDEIHMGADMTCVDCHMSRPVGEGDDPIIHHTMIPDPRTCNDCHGNIHTLQFDPARDLTEADQELVAMMQEQVADLEDKADTNLESGIVGGAVGSLVLVGFLLIAIRFGRMR